MYHSRLLIRSEPLYDYVSLTTSYIWILICYNLGRTEGFQSVLPVYSSNSLSLPLIKHHRTPYWAIHSQLRPVGFRSALEASQSPPRNDRVFVNTRKLYELTLRRPAYGALSLMPTNESTRTIYALSASFFVNVKPGYTIDLIPTRIAQ